MSVASSLLRSSSVVGALLGSALLPEPALANGFFAGVQGTRAAGRAGAFVAKADDLSAAHINPAGLSRQRGTRIFVSNRFAYSDERYKRAATLDWSDLNNQSPAYVEFAEVSNARPWQLLDPMLGVSTDFGLKNWTFALSAHAPAGNARQEFPIDGGQRYMLVSRDVQILYYNLSAAWQHEDVFGVGATFQWVDVPKLAFELVIDGNTLPRQVSPVSSALDMRAQIEGADHVNFSAVVGAWWRPFCWLEFAASSQILPVHIDTQSTISVEPVFDTVTDPIVLTRGVEGEANDVTMQMTLPVSARVAARYIGHRADGSEAFDVELNLGWEAWSMVDSFVMNGNGLVGKLGGQQIDVGLIELEKNWKDSFSVRLGSDIAVVPERLTLRLGAFYESAVVDPAYAFVDFFAGHQYGGSLGASVFMGDFELSLAYAYMRQAELHVRESESAVHQQVPGSQCVAPYTDPDNCDAHYLGRPAAVANAGRYRAQYHAASLSLGYQF